MATPPNEFVDTRDIPDSARSVLEPAPPANPHAFPPPSHRSTEPDPILDSLPPWLARLGDGSWPVFRADQLWGVVAAVLLIVLVVMAIQRGPILPSFTSVESGAPGSGAENPAGPEADGTELSATARSSERLGDPTEDDDDGVVSQPANETSGGSRAKIFSRSSRKKSTATTGAIDGFADSDRDTIEFDPDDGPGVGAGDGSIDGVPGTGDRVTPPTTDDDDDITGSATTDDARGSSRRSTSSISSASATTRPTINTTTSTTRFVISTVRTTTTTRTSSTTTTTSPTSSATTRSTTTTTSSPTSTLASSTSSTAATTTISTAVTSSTGASTSTPTASGPDETEPDPETETAVASTTRRPVE